MDVLSEANLEYEAELKRNPGIPRVWLNYLADSKHCSHEVCPPNITNAYVIFVLVPNLALCEVSGGVSPVL